MNNFWLFSFGTGPDACYTISGPDANKPCIFPFRHDGVTHNTCTLASTSDNKPWCSTLVDDSGNHVKGQGNFGDCGPECPTENGESAIILKIEKYISTIVFQITFCTSLKRVTET